MDSVPLFIYSTCWTYFRSQFCLFMWKIFPPWKLFDKNLVLPGWSNIVCLCHFWVLLWYSCLIKLFVWDVEGNWWLASMKLQWLFNHSVILKGWCAFALFSHIDYCHSIILSILFSMKCFLINCLLLLFYLVLDIPTWF